MAAPNNDLLTTIVQLSLEDSSELSNQELGENQDTHTTVQKLKTDLRQVIDKLNEVCLVNSAMLSKISELVKENNKMYTELENTKIELNELNQYGRRENIEICGIPESIEPMGLEKHVIEVLKSIKVTVSPYQLVGVHRVGKKQNNRPRNVIVRFVNRKHAFMSLKNKKLLKNSNKKYYIIENLCPFHKKLFNRLYKCKKENDIHSVWSYNGLVYAKVDENDEPTQICTMDDIDELLEGSEYGDDGDMNEDAEDESPSVASEAVANDAVASVAVASNDDSSHVDNSFSGSFKTPLGSSQSRRKSKRLSDISEEIEVRTPIEPLKLPRNIKV